MGPVPKIDRGIMLRESFVDSLVSATADLSRWRLQNGAGSGSFALADNEPDGVGVITTGTSDQNTTTIGLNGEPFQTDPARVIKYATRLKVTTASRGKFFCGLHEDSGLTNGNVLALIASGFNGVGFYQDHATGGTALIKCIVGKASTNITTLSPSTAQTMADATFVDLAFIIYGQSRVEFYVNGTMVGSIVTNIPTATLSSYLQILTQPASSGAAVLSVDGVQIDHPAVTG